MKYFNVIKLFNYLISQCVTAAQEFNDQQEMGKKLQTIMVGDKGKRKILLSLLRVIIQDKIFNVDQLLNTVVGCATRGMSYDAIYLWYRDLFCRVRHMKPTNVLNGNSPIICMSKSLSVSFKDLNRYEVWFYTKRNMAKMEFFTVMAPSIEVAAVAFRGYARPIFDHIQVIGYFNIELANHGN